MPNTAKIISFLIALFLQFANSIQAQQISGNIFIDRDGLTDNNINTSAGLSNPSATVTGLELFVNLLNGSGQAVASTPLSSTGGFLFSNVPNGDYVAQLTIHTSNGSYTTPVAAPNTTLPSGWVNTGELIGNGVGNDGNVNGKSANIAITSSSVISNVNFGIERLPETISVMGFIATGGSSLPLTVNVLNNLTNAPFKGSDVEDLPLSSSLVGKSIKIQSLIIHSVPSLSYYETATLFYDGNAVNVGQIIPSYNPSLLKVSFSNTQNCSECFSGHEVNFYYSFIDAAGFADPSPAIYRILYPVASPIPFLISNFEVTKRNCNATLHWKTTTEFDTKNFEAEYSTSTNSTFTSIGTISASVNSTTEKKYEFNYLLESDVVYHFRIKMTKKNGTVSYSNVQSISCLESELKIEIAPNPVLSMFRINGMLKGKNTISIYAKDGNVVANIVATNNKDINVSHLQAGIYVVRIVNENGTSSVERLIKY